MDISLQTIQTRINNFKRTTKRVVSKGINIYTSPSINQKKNLRLQKDAGEDYAKKWVKHEPDEPKLDTLSECITAIRSCIQQGIQKLRCTLSIRITNSFKNTEVAHVADVLSSFNDKYVVVPTDKVYNNIVVICKNDYLECLTQELEINSKTTNSKYA